MVSNQFRPPGFPPIPNNQNHFNPNQGNNFNQNRGTNFNQNRNFNQGQVYQPPTIQPLVYQAPPQQMQGVSKTDFENYVKANDAVLRNMQNQGQGLQNQMTNLTEMLSKFITSNTASVFKIQYSSKSNRPSTPLIPTPIVSTPLKELGQNSETSMNKVQKPSSENTAQVPLPEDHDSIFIEIPKPKAKKIVQEPNLQKPNSYQTKLPIPRGWNNENPLFNEKDEDVENENSNVSDSDEPVLLNTPLSDKVECSDPGMIIPPIIRSESISVMKSIIQLQITFSPRNGPLHHEFAGELLTLTSRIVREHEEYLSLMTVLCEISTSRSQENVHLSSIPVEDSEPVQEEMDIFLVPDDLIPPGVENDDSKDEDNELPNLDQSRQPIISTSPPERTDDRLNFSEDSRVRVSCPVHWLELPAYACH
ncbi:hypothetical protein Tco_0530376 [Tanacetum coccineum]